MRTGSLRGLDLEARLGPDLVRRIERAGRRHVGRVFQATQRAVPVDTRALKESGRVEQAGSHSFLIAYGYRDPETVDYGAIVHEDRRYLATPAYLQARTLGRDVAGAVRGVRPGPLREVK